MIANYPMIQRRPPYNQAHQAQEFQFSRYLILEKIQKQTNVNVTMTKIEEQKCNKTKSNEG